MRFYLPRESRSLLILVGLIFAAIGCVGLVSPTGVVGPVGLELSTVAAHSEVRAAFGGLYLCFGLYFLFTAVGRGRRREGLRMVALFLGGLVLGRVVSVVIDGFSPNPWLWLFAVLEVVLFALSAWMLWHERQGTTTSQEAPVAPEQPQQSGR